MAMRFRRSTKIAPGVKVNLSKKNVGVTVGSKGAHYSVNSSGRKTTTVGVPGTGVSFVDVSSKKHQQGGGGGSAERRPMSKGVYIALLVVAILWTIALGLPLLTIAPVIGVVLIAVGVFFIVLAIKGIKLYKTAKETPIEPQPVAKETVTIAAEQPAPVIVAAPAAPTNEETHKVAGLSFREDALAELQYENEDYSCSKRELVEIGMIGERIYKYDFYPVKTELIPEPDNEVDPNAIKVVVDGEHIGYIKKGSCAHIRKLLNSGSIEKIDVEIGGGPYKFITAEDWDENGGDVYTIEKGVAPYFAKLTITKT